MRYSRFVPRHDDEDQEVAALMATQGHVRAHLSSVADADDDPTTHAKDVRVQVLSVDGGWLINGVLDADPDAPYLKDDFDPYDGVPAELRALAMDDEVTP